GSIRESQRSPRSVSSKARQSQISLQHQLSAPHQLAVQLPSNCQDSQAPPFRSHQSVVGGCRWWRRRQSSHADLRAHLCSYITTQPTAQAASLSSSATPTSIDSSDAARIEEVGAEDDSEDLMSVESRLSEAIDASLSVVERFASQLPGFSSFEASDRAALLTAHALDVVLARTAYRFSAACQNADEPDPSLRSFQLDSGHRFSARCLTRLGLANVADALANCGRQLRQLMNGDCAAFAGLVTILLVYFCPEEESLPLCSPGEVYKQHHNYIEMLKSHCCSQSAQSSGNRDSTFLSRVLQQKSVIRTVTRDVLAPSLIARLGSRLSPE
uniref:NR LBD domain-containing protein n=1 Tax=Macrostomum lignano TaxID=282301 RepID=A0A1I8F2A3_9PLAT